MTKLGGASWAPFYLPDNRRIIFSSDYNTTQGFGAFDLFIIDENGTGLEKVSSYQYYNITGVIFNR